MFYTDTVGSVHMWMVIWWHQEARVSRLSCTLFWLHVLLMGTSAIIIQIWCWFLTSWLLFPGNIRHWMHPSLINCAARYSISLWVFPAERTFLLGAHNIIQSDHNSMSLGDLRAVSVFFCPFRDIDRCIYSEMYRCDIPLVRVLPEDIIGSLPNIIRHFWVLICHVGIFYIRFVSIMFVYANILLGLCFIGYYGLDAVNVIKSLLCNGTDLIQSVVFEHSNFMYVVIACSAIH